MGASEPAVTMVDPTLVEEIWSSLKGGAAYLAEMRQVCLPAGTMANSSGSLAELPALFCGLHGGGRSQVIPIVTAWTLLRHAARILDDIEDGEAKLAATTLNVSTGLIFTASMALNVLERYGVSAISASDIRQKFYSELLTTCSGQHLDLTLSTPSPEAWWQIAGAKSGTFMGLICWAGGRAACAPPERLELYREFGHTLGLLDQLRDDLTDLWPSDAHLGDLHHLHNCGLPVAYALAVLPADQRQQLLTHLARIATSPAEEEKARDIIVKSGAGVYLSVESIRLYQQGLQVVDQMDLPEATRQKLMGWLDKARLPAVKT